MDSWREFTDILFIVPYFTSYGIGLYVFSASVAAQIALCFLFADVRDRLTHIALPRMG